MVLSMCGQPVFWFSTLKINQVYRVLFGHYSHAEDDTPRNKRTSCHMCRTRGQDTWFKGPLCERLVFVMYEKINALDSLLTQKLFLYYYKQVALLVYQLFTSSRFCLFGLLTETYRKHLFQAIIIILRHISSVNFWNNCLEE